MIVTSEARLIALYGQDLTNNPFFAWDNLAADAVLSGTTPLAGGDYFNATNGTTADFWLPDVTATTANYVVDFTADQAISFAAIAAHNLHDFGASVAIQSSPDGSAWTNRGAVTPATDGGPMVFRFVAFAARYWRVRLTGLTSGNPLAIGVVFLGNETVFPSRIYQGFSPIITANMVEVASNVSVGGNLMGSSTVSRGAKLDMSFQHIPPAFLRGPFKPFLEQFNDGRGFFTAWRPGKYADDVHYCWRDGGVVQPTNAGPHELMDMSLSMRVHYGG